MPKVGNFAKEVTLPRWAPLSRMASMPKKAIFAVEGNSTEEGNFAKDSDLAVDSNVAEESDFTKAGDIAEKDNFAEEGEFSKNFAE